MRPTCPVCHLDFEQGEQGYIVGTYMMNIVGAELIFLAGFLGVLTLTWPSPPWQWLQWGGMALVVVVPVFTYPFSKTIFLAMHLTAQPAPVDRSPPRAE
jgi:uncharacterized protein (DUF983 family)